jgi:CubicO group peptidase (beta-lactamase class C family)
MAKTPAGKSTAALYLPAETRFWQFSPQAAPGQSVGGLPLTGSDSFRFRLERHVEPGFAPGVVGLVAHGPFVETVALGRMAFGAGSDMRRDTIFRIGSQTKAVTAAAVVVQPLRCPPSRRAR